MTESTIDQRTRPRRTPWYPILVGVAILSMLISLAANAQTPISTWTYEPLQGTTAQPTPNTGTGTSFLVGAMTGAGTATGMATATGCGGQTSGTNAWAISTANPGTSDASSGAQFNVSTAGFQNIRFQWEQRWSGTATNTVRLQYTTNGSTWTNFTMTASNTTFCNGSLDNGRFQTNTSGDQYRRIAVDLSAITGVNNNASFGVRVVASHYQNTGQFRQCSTPTSVATAGTWRFDNVIVSGESAVPPSIQDQDITFNDVLTTSMTISWVPGNGSGSVVKMNTTNSFTAPADGTTPVADPVYTTGEQVIYNGEGNSVEVSGLQPGTTYWVRAYGRNGTGAGTLYNTATASANPASQTTTSIQAPVKLEVISLNDGSSIIQDQPFFITVQAQDANSVPQPVTQNTEVSISLLDGVGNITGDLTATILQGSDQVTITGLLYDEADPLVELEIATLAGDVLTSAIAGPFTVLGSAAILAFENVPSFGITTNTLAPFQVLALREDGTSAPEYSGTITIDILSGPGLITGTTSKATIDGVVTFDDINLDTPGEYLLIASAAGLDEGVSPSILITLPLEVQELVVPRYIGSKSAASANTGRTPLAVALQFDNLLPNTSYDISAGIGLTTDAATILGAGNVWNGTAYSGSTIANAFTTDAAGSSGVYWLFLETTGNASRFGAGQEHNLRINMRQVGGSFAPAPVFISTNTITSLDIAPTALSASTTDDGAYFLGRTAACEGGNFILAYDNVDGSGEPLSVHQARPLTGTSLPANVVSHPSTVADVLSQSGSSVEGEFLLIIPAGTTSSLGVRRLELRDAQNVVRAVLQSADGTWPGGANTATIARRDVMGITPEDALLAPDADGDGLADCEDSCPLVPGQIGDACDDGDPNTVNETLNEDCVCEGSTVDCEGVAGGSALIGTSCDDGDPNTVNDTWDANCECVGEFLDCENVPGGSAFPGTPCDDEDPATINDTWTSACECIGIVPEFGAGNLVVLQIGDGSAPLVNTGAPLVVREFTTTGAAGFSIPVPSTGDQAMILSGTAASEGYMSLSSDGRKLVFAGYATTLPNGTTLNSSTGTAIPRAVGSMDAYGNFVREATSTTFFSANNPRGAASNGTDIWGVGANQGVNYFGPGTQSLVSAAKANLRAAAVFGDQLYVSTSAAGGTPAGQGVFAVGTGTPTTSGEAMTAIALTGNTGTGGFHFNPTNTILYVAVNNGVQKWVKDTEWQLAYTLAFTGGANAVVADHSGINDTLYVINGGFNQLLKITDPGTGTASVDVVPVIISEASAGTAWRSLSFAPRDCDIPVIASITPAQEICSLDELQLEVVATGDGPFTYVWNGAGVFAPGTDAASVTVIGAESGTYQVVVSNDCGTTMASTHVTVTEAVEWYADTDGDGLGDPNDTIMACEQPVGYVANADDECPGTFGTVGDTCDDGDPDTVNDTIDENCVCVGQSEDCLGVIGGSATVGTSCDDGDPNTVNDTWDANCECVGEVLDCENVAGGSALPGTPCDDGDPATINDTWTSACECIGIAPEFGAGNLVVLQVGDGIAPLVNTGSPLVVREFTTTGTSGFSIPVPTSGDHTMILSGTASSEGYMSLSSDGRKLVFAGYAASLPNGTALNSSTGTTIPRAVGSMNAYGNFVREATSTTFFSGNNPRGAASNGTDIWGVGANQGVNYFGPGTQSLVSAAKTNLRAAAVFGDQLFVSTSAAGGTPAGQGVFAVGTGTPTTSGEVMTAIALTGNAGTGGFHFDPTGTTLYVAVNNGVQKWVKDTEWQLAYTLAFTGGANAVVADHSGLNDTLYVINGGFTQLLAITDPGTGTGSVDVVPVIISEAPSGTVWRSLSFAPRDCDIPMIASITPAQEICSLDELQLEVVATGDGPFTYVWNRAGVFAPGTDAASVTVSGAESGTYQVVVSNDCGTAMASTQVTVTEAVEWYADTDGDGLGDPDDTIMACEQPTGYVANADDECPGTFGTVGDTCDDGDPNTVNETIDENCVCVGQSEDCLGVVGGSATEGTPCDDGNPNTVNETWNANCECVGEVLDCENVAGGSALPGTPCDDGDPTTFNDTWTNDCDCIGTSFSFGAGNIVVERLGTGAAALSNAATPVFIDEYLADEPGQTSLVSTFALPAAAPQPTEAPFNLTESGTASSNGYLTLATHGEFLAIPGYNAVSGTASIAGSNAATIGRTIGMLDANGVVSTPTAINMLSGNNYRSLASDGTAFWAAGGVGIQYVASATATTSTTVITTNTRNVALFNGDLYYSTGSGTAGIYRFEGKPEASATATLVVAVNQPYAFALDPAGNVLYVANDAVYGNTATGGGVKRYDLVDGVWTLSYTLRMGEASTTGARGLTVDFSGPAPVLYGTTTEASNNRIVRVVDNGSEQDAIDATNAFVLASAGTNRVYRGVAFAPQPCTPPVVTTTTGITSICSTDDLVLGVVASGSGELSYAWTGAGVNTLNTSSITVTGASTGTYSVAVSNTCGTDNASFEVTVTEATTWYEDIDADGLGDPLVSVLACQQPEGFVANADDECVGVFGTIGDTCDAGPGFTNGEINADCECAGTPVAEEDCLGVVGGSALPGTPCDAGPGMMNGEWSSDCQCVGEEEYVTVDNTSRVILDGAYATGSGLMGDNLRSLGLIPAAHPYAGAPFNHTGTETVAPAVLAVTGNDAIVDWILLELRADGAPATIVARRAALLQRDGNIVDVDGVSPVRFNVAAGDYHLAIRHRNHLAVMTASSYTLSQIPTDIDLAVATTATFGTNARRTVGGVMTMWAGNVNSDAVVNYSGSNNDRAALLNTLGASNYLTPINGYYNADVNMSGVVTYSGTTSDRAVILNTLGASSYLIPITQQLP